MDPEIDELRNELATLRVLYKKALRELELTRQEEIPCQES